jgi:vancomycin resistance protein YoaR
MQIFQWRTKKNIEQTERKERAALMTAFIVIAALLVVLGVPIVAYTGYYSDKIVRGVSVDGVELGGLTQKEAQELLQSRVNEVDQKGFQFIAEGKTVSIRPTQFALGDPDLTYEILSFNVSEMVSQAYEVGHADDIFTNLKEQAGAIFKGATLPIAYELDKQSLILALKENFGDLEEEGQNVQVEMQDGEVVFIPESQGVRLNYEGAINELERSMSLLSQNPISIKKEPFVPDITLTMIESLRDEVSRVAISDTELRMRYEQRTWTVPSGVYAQLLGFVLNDEGKPMVAFDPEKLAEYLVRTVQPDVHTEPVDAVLVFNEDKTEVIEFSPQKPGRRLMLDETVEVLNQKFFKEGSLEEIALVVDEAQPEVELGELNELGIKEIIGVGTSDYSGSPVNRRHNVEVGRKSFDGVLIAPGEEFSALKSLGPVDGANGYLPELVIKGNETVPEYGGGLCQVSTTIFRAALDAGLKITQRRNHSYNVSYYSPTGTDATIYDPAPDFRFLNDTQHHVLVHTVNDTQNSRLIYEIWGTKDGRTVEMTEPVQYDWVPAPPTKIIETTDLAPGVKKCTESAHAGVKAYFDRVITRSDGNVEEERFHSTYRPWQAVCLVGVEELSNEAAEGEQEGEEPVVTDPEGSAVVEQESIPEAADLPFPQ